LVFINKKIIKSKFKKKTKTEIGLNRPVSVRFCFLGQKLVQTGLARFSWVWLGFLGFGLVFFVLARFFSVWLGVFFGSVRFGFFGFLLIKPKPNRTDRFFQNFNWFFYGSVFQLFFVQFSRFNWFFSFFAHHYFKPFIQFNISKFFKKKFKIF
jgi:hypothetical protein